MIGWGAGQQSKGQVLSCQIYVTCGPVPLNDMLQIDSRLLPPSCSQWWHAGDRNNVAFPIDLMVISAPNGSIGVLWRRRRMKHYGIRYFYCCGVLYILGALGDWREGLLGPLGRGKVNHKVLKVHSSSTP